MVGCLAATGWGLVTCSVLYLIIFLLQKRRSILKMDDNILKSEVQLMHKIHLCVGYSVPLNHYLSPFVA